MQATPLQSPLLTCNLWAPTKICGSGTAAQTWIWYIHWASQKSPKFVQRVDVLLILCCVNLWGQWSNAFQMKKVREWLAPGSGGGQMIAGCTGLCSQNFFSYRLLKISQYLNQKSSSMIADGLSWCHEFILNSMTHWDVLGAKTWELFSWLATSDAFAVAA